MSTLTRSLIILLLAALAACAGAPPADNASGTRAVITPQPPEPSANTETQPPTAHICPLTEAVWAVPPNDAAVQNEPAYGYYFVNDDRSMWASAWWIGQEGTRLRASDDGIKVGWFRPAGATLAITGQRIDAQAPPLSAHIPCCYPTRFQATGLYFPTEGCWAVTATAGASELSFVVLVES